MQRLGCRQVKDYIRVLDLEPAAHQECELLMTVSISRFFRDRRLWEMLEKHWLPDIIADEPSQLKVWSAGCACGEEVYSFNIVWERLRMNFADLPPLDLLASDRHPGYLERGRKGAYNRSSLTEVDPDCRERYFESRKGGRQFVIREYLKSRIRWEIHHLSTAPPGTGFDIIFLRNNVLTYYRQAARENILNSILGSLSPGGLLIIGSHENLPSPRPTLKVGTKLPCVFQKIDL